MAFATLLGALTWEVSAAGVIDSIAAQVGSEIVLLSEVTQLSESVEREIRANGASEAEILEVRSRVLERLIERRLIDQVVKKAELEAIDSEIDHAIQSIAKENKLSPEQLRESVEANGLAFPAYRERIRGEIQHMKVLNGMVRSRVRVEESEVRELYDKRFSDQPAGGTEVHLLHLLIGVTEQRDLAAACEKIEEALSRMRAGAKFQEVGQQLSETNPETGGDLGWLHQDNLAAWMAPVVASLQPGQTSEAISTPFGCNALHLLERREHKRESYEEARAELRAELFDQRVEVEYSKLLDKLRAQTFIDRKGGFARAPERPAVSQEGE